MASQETQRNIKMQKHRQKKAVQEAVSDKQNAWAVILETRMYFKSNWLYRT